MQYKKTILLSISILFLMSFLYANSNIGTYTYDLDTVISIMKLSLVEEGVEPFTPEFDENINNLRNIISSFGETEFVKSMQVEAPFSCIEVSHDSLILHLKSGEFSIPIEIVKDAIYSKDPESLDAILGYFNNDKLFFNFLVTYESNEKTAIKNDDKEFYLIPFIKQQV